jgi:hypothetical protein
MCPACLTTAALIAAGATSAGGLTAFGLKKLRALAGVKAAVPNPQPGAKTNGTRTEDRVTR